ncbi:IS1182 family transposase [Rossellomorea marisflavi]|uniref:IS1182 family transposase n=1 Tax=Rossellomorea marisflavi TaxID=189381 RepID=UPI00279ABC44|nr:IS1182 family transposase [Rossellomorea marisflavi]UTE73443.1 IS1182 family transposase [Rossellomorea marisflavi]UTE74387.1 IS1182 family transposase [Rossellomorea marisflavi]
MINGQLSMNFSQFEGLYDMVVPKHHLLRKINDLVDFTFVYEELKDKYCHTNGRNAVHPIRMFKYLLLKTIYTLSDVDLVERAQVDMSFKYFLEMAPEEEVIDPSLLAYFRRKRLNDDTLLDLLVEKSVEMAIEQNVIQSKSVILDATHTRARYNQTSPQEVLRKRSKTVRKSIYAIDESMKEKFPEKPTSDDLEAELEYSQRLVEVIEKEPTLVALPSLKEPLNLLKETMEDDRLELRASEDPDARVGHKSADSSFFGYKTHLAMSQERIITAATVTTGEQTDGKQLQTLVEKSQKAGMEVDEIIGDAAYSGKENIAYATKHDITLVSKLNPSVSKGFRKKEDEFEYNKDAGMFVCPAGHMAIRKARQGKKDAQRNQTDTYYFDVEKCQRCPFQEGCYKEGAKTKTYSVRIKSEEHEQQGTFQNSETFKERAKERYKIEAKNSELKHRHGYEIASSSGLRGMRIQGAMAIFTVNLKRILKLMEE